MYRIGLVGSSGTGKSSLARRVSAELHVPFFAAKDITQGILARDCYDYGSGIQVERFLATEPRQRELLDATWALHGQRDQFVTDRTFVDLAAYAAVEMCRANIPLVEEVMETCRERVSVYTHLFLCPWSNVPMEGNQKRTLNPWYQYVVYACEVGILADWGVAFHRLETKGEDARVAEIVGITQAKP